MVTWWTGGSITVTSMECQAITKSINKRPRGCPTSGTIKYIQSETLLVKFELLKGQTQKTTWQCRPVLLHPCPVGGAGQQAWTWSGPNSTPCGAAAG